MTTHTAHLRAAFQRRLFSFTLGATVALAVWTTTQSVSAQRLGPSGLDEVATGSWTKLTNQPTFNTDSANLLTDGTVLVHQYNSNVWWKLTPDINGSYSTVPGPRLASMQTDYAPLYFANAVLPDGRLIVEGGEYNNLPRSGRIRERFMTPRQCLDDTFARRQAGLTSVTRRASFSQMASL